ncbi:HepT-like ribonuclease domain-containing protein [Rhodomicrobium lacus]|uniref:HepT-like ribonuclease domain-containing protein n=1 Tax=Rhodomicrobium lacus TaxID=2498452 RepID=UPI0013DFFFD3|nr:HepT-like ribonuclease domain-containing protein [Rhodomicrobium lacus]
MTASSHSNTARNLAQVVENIDVIEAYVAGLEESAFLADAKTRDAVERCLQRLIEALDRIRKRGDENIIPGLPWTGIQGLGNRLRHEYDAIDGVQIWAIVKEDLPSLKTAALKALKGFG